MFDDDAIDDGLNVLVDFTQTVHVVRMVGNVIVPARLTVKAQVLPAQDAVELDFDITFAKVRFWFQTILARSMIFCRYNKQAIEMFVDDDGKPRITNCLMITPHEPTDEHLGALFQSKMTALSGGTMEFGVVRVNSESETGLVWSYVGDWRQDLPDMEHWFSEKPYYFDSPWWTRDDPSTLDTIAHGVTDFSKPPSWAFSLDFIEKSLRPRVREEANAATADDIVIRGAFRPKVIEGGSEE